MPEIIALTHCLTPYLSKTTLRQLRVLILALLCISGRVTTLGLSRWAERGGSHRTLQRWFQTPIDWGQLLWIVVKEHLVTGKGVYLLAGDEVVVSKAGKKTHGLGRFYSSLAQRPIPGLSFLVLSVIDVSQRRSYPVCVEQRLPVVRTKAATPSTPKRGPGRPKGSVNYAKAAPALTPELALLASMLRRVLVWISPLRVEHVVLDGFFGTSTATAMVRDSGLHLISKLRSNTALYWPYSGPKPQRGPTPRYGDKLKLDQLPDSACIQTVITDTITTRTYHVQVWHKEFAELLNVVILVKTNAKTHKAAPVILFSTDLRLSADQIRDYYSLRFQIEFNFRDAKQSWGLEDYMNVSAAAVTNAVHLSFLMVNLSAALLPPYRQQQPEFSVLDLKLHYRTRRYVAETLHSLPTPPPPDVLSRLWRRLSSLGSLRSSSRFQDAA